MTTADIKTQNALRWKVAAYASWRCVDCGGNMMCVIRNSDGPVDPLSDLNVCAEMREHLSDEEWYKFVDALLGKPWTSAWDWDDVVKLVSAPAEEQCRAFVAAKESK